MNPSRNVTSAVSHPSRARLHPGAGNTRERGIALIMTLLLLTMVMALSVGMVIAMSSQSLIGGYYRNFRGSFYAADSGLNVGVMTLENQLTAGIPTAFANPPIASPTTLATNVLSTLNSSYGSSTSLNAGDASSSWKESFKITSSSLSLAPGSPTITSYDNTTAGCTPTTPCPTGYQYIWNYALTTVGSSSGSESQAVSESGIITLKITGLAKANSVSFAYFGAFIDVYSGGTGPLVPGTMTGPMFTNGAWEFMPPTAPWTSPYIFTDPVGQVASQADYWNTSHNPWTYTASSADSYGSGSQLVAPTFDEGFFMSQPAVALPSNTFNQEEAVVDGMGNAGWTNAQTTAGLAALTNVTSTSTPWTGSTSSGVFVNQGTTATTCGTKTPPCILGGGFLVESKTVTTDVQLLPVTGSDTAQKYVITQNGTATTIVVDPAANGGVGTTTITQGSTTYPTLSGVPENYLLSQPQTMLYVDGQITVHGGGQGQPAVQDNSMISITANGNITATGDVLYKTEPVTIPADTLVPATGTNPMNQVLGLYTANGNFVTNTSQTNIEIDASIATISPTESAHCSSGASAGGGQTSVTTINTFNNVGGMIQSCIYPAPISTENTWFDRRFTARAGFAPPWFPSTQLQQGGALPVNTTPTIQRLQWLNTSAQ